MSILSDAARRAVSFGLPTVDLQQLLVNFALDPGSPEFKAPLNGIRHMRQPADPAQVSLVNLNVDTPYSYAWLDLRTGPVLLTMPRHEADRYMSAELVDLYGYIIGYVSPRTSGAAGGTFLVHGPSSGAPQLRVDATFECPTDLCIVLVRTQLFDEADLPSVAALQDEVCVQALGPPAEPLRPMPTVDVRKPLDEGFLRSLDWMLRLMPRLPEDADLRDTLALTGCGGPDGRIDEVLADPAALLEIRLGLAQGMQDVEERCATVRSSAEIFGTREFFGGDYVTKAAGAMLGILGNAAEEYLGVGYRADEHGRPFSGADEYSITFPPGGLPPVGAFWSITVYDADQHLYDNELNRYVIGSRQLPAMRRDSDGGVTLRIGHRSPGLELEPNWLPCPAGSFGLTFRTYLPGPEIRNGTWAAPPVRRTADENPVEQT